MWTCIQEGKRNSEKIENEYEVLQRRVNEGGWKRFCAENYTGHLGNLLFR